MSGGIEGKIRLWQVSDGKEVEEPMNAGRAVYSIAVSRDGKWILSGLSGGKVVVWNAETREKVNEFQGHYDEARAVDISSDGTKIVSGSDDCTVCVWSLSTVQRLLGPFEHAGGIVTQVKFSPDGRRIATSIYSIAMVSRSSDELLPGSQESVRIYDSQNGYLLVDFPIVPSNRPFAWSNDSKQLFVLSRDGRIHHLNVSTKTTFSEWDTHSINCPNRRCIALSSNGAFIAASAGSSVSLWDTTTHNQIGSLLHLSHDILSMAISENYDLVTGGDTRVTLRSFLDTVSPPYIDDHVGDLRRTLDT